jgi:hypothetical protein
LLSSQLSDAYNRKLLDGRWDHMMDQTHIGYTYWQEPPLNAMPAVSEVRVPAHGSLSVATGQGTPLRQSLGTFDSVAQQTRTVKLFNSGGTPIGYTLTTSAPWILVSRREGSVKVEDSFEVHVDWKTAPAEHAMGTVTVTPQTGAPMQMQLESLWLPGVTRENAEGFVESDGYVAIEVADTSSRTADGTTHWEELPGFGETRSAMTVFPVTAASNLNSAAALKYRIYLSDEGDFTLHAVLAPTLNFVPGRGLRFAVSIDGGPRIVIDALEHNTDKDWEEAVSDGVKKVSVPLSISHPGYHSLAIWMVDPGVVLERLVLSHGPLRPSYLGPPESFHAQTYPHTTSEAGPVSSRQP